MRQARATLLLATVLFGCVSAKTINDLRLLPLSPSDRHEVIWTEPVLQWVNPFSPAGLAGLSRGDQLVSLNGTAALTVDQTQTFLWDLGERKSLDVVYVRKGVTARTVVHDLHSDTPLGMGVYPDDATYSLKGFPGLPPEVGFLEYGSARLSLYVGRFSDQPEILLLRFQIDNVRSGPMRGPTAVQVLGSNGALFHQLSPGAAVGYLLPNLGSQSPYAPYLPYRPPVYTISPDRQHLYPQNDPYTAMANSITAIGNMITSVNNARKARREQDREALYKQLNEASLRSNTIPEGGRDAGTLVYHGSTGGPIRVMVQIENDWHTLTFQ